MRVGEVTLLVMLVTQIVIQSRDLRENTDNFTFFDLEHVPTVPTAAPTDVPSGEEDYWQRFGCIGEFVWFEEPG